MQDHFDKLLTCCSETCTKGTCRTYAYSLAFLDKNVEDLEDLESVLSFLKE